LVRFEVDEGKLGNPPLYCTILFRWKKLAVEQGYGKKLLI
jgi:hypothetical protein